MIRRQILTTVPTPSLLEFAVSPLSGGTKSFANLQHTKVVPEATFRAACLALTHKQTCGQSAREMFSCCAAKGRPLLLAELAASVKNCSKSNVSALRYQGGQAVGMWAKTYYLTFLRRRGWKDRRDAQFTKTLARVTCVSYFFLTLILTALYVWVVVKGTRTT